MNDATTPPPIPPNEPPTAPPSGGGDSGNRTLMLVLAYLGPLALVPLIAEKQDADLQWHAKHGLLLFGISFVGTFGLSLVLNIIPFLGCIALPFLALLGLVLFVLDIVAMVKAVGGERFMIPGISPLVDKF